MYIPEFTEGFLEGKYAVYIPNEEDKIRRAIDLFGDINLATHQDTHVLYLTFKDYLLENKDKWRVYFTNNSITDGVHIFNAYQTVDAFNHNKKSMQLIYVDDIEYYHESKNEINEDEYLLVLEGG